MGQLTSGERASGITIKRIELTEDIAASQTLRYRVWSEQEGVALKDSASGRIADGLDETAYHWGAFNGDTLIGSARLSVHHDLGSVPDAELFSETPIPLPTASLNRLVVEQSVRGKGVARQLDEQRIAFAQSIKMRSVIVAPINRKSRVDSLLELGFILLDKTGTAKWSKMPIAAMWLPL